MKRSGLLLTTSLILLIISLFGVYLMNSFARNQGLFPKTDAAPSVILSGQPPNYQKNSHVTRTVTPTSDNYIIEYKFKDHRDILRTWKVRFSKGQTDYLIYQYGIPKSMFEPYYSTEEVLTQRKKQLVEGMYKQEGNTLRPNHDAMATYYKGFTEPIADLAKQVLGPNPPQAELIEFLLRFCQDIPYGVPPTYFNDKHIGQIFPPAQSLVNMYADCDSKVVLFASAYTHFPNADLIYVHSPGHMSTAIAGVPTPYQSSYTYKNKRYIFAEPVGPGRLNWGADSGLTGRVNKVFEASVSSSYPAIDYQLLSSESRSATAPTSGNIRGRWCDTEKGQLTFWLTSPNYGAVTIYINDVKQGQLTSYHRGAPDCGDDGTVSVLKPGGTYRFKAVSSKGTKWESSIQIVNDQCQMIRLGN